MNKYDKIAAKRAKAAAKKSKIRAKLGTKPTKEKTK